VNPRYRWDAVAGLWVPLGIYLPDGVFLQETAPSNPTHQAWTWLEVDGPPALGGQLVQVWAYDTAEHAWVPFQPAVAGRIQVFTISGSWVKPALGGFTVADVYAYGPGGPGATGRSGSTNVHGGSGGGSGGVSFDSFLLSGLAGTVTCTVGARGIAPTTPQGTGTNGGTTSFGTLLTATGGTAGSWTTTGLPVAGAGGTGNISNGASGSVGSTSASPATAASGGGGGGGGRSGFAGGVPGSNGGSRGLSGGTGGTSSTSHGQAGQGMATATHPATTGGGGGGGYAPPNDGTFPSDAGDGGFPGGGGGGSGGQANSGHTGSPGDGGGGLIIVVCA
jgi:hypothetical protein